MKQLIFLMALFYLIQTYGSNPGIFDIPLSLYLKDNLNLDAAESASFWSLVGLPWFIKPLWGVIADSFPLFGYRMKGYFITCYTLAFAVLLGLARFSGYTTSMLLISMVIVSTCIAFSDVLTDKLMVVEGKSKGKTSILQAAQWSARGLGGASMYYLGGWIVQNANLSFAFLLTAIVPFLGLIATLFILPEAKIENSKVSLKKNIKALWLGVRSPQFLAAFIFIACFRFRPEPPILYYQRDVLSFEADFLGILGAIISISVGLGAIFFGTFAYKISRRNLLNLTIALRSISTLALVFIQDEKSAILIWLFCGFTDVMATLGALEVAATACLDESEGTAYALLMSLWNFANTPGVILGGWLWDRGMQFSVIVSLSALSTALCWFLIPLLKLDRE